MLRVGLIGAGMVSRHHLLGWAALGGKGQVVAIADPSAENRDHRAREFGVPGTYPDLDTMRILLGELRVTACRLGRSCPDMAGEDNALISLESGDGAAAVLLGNMAAPGFSPTQADDMLLLGSAGTVRLHGSTLACHGHDPEEREYDLAACYQDSYNACIAHFVDALATGVPFETSPADNLRTLRLVEDCYALADQA